MADPIDFDYQGAVKAGYSPQEVQDYLKNSHGVDFDVQGAKKAGYSDSEIGDYIKSIPSKSTNQPQPEKVLGDNSSKDSNYLTDIADKIHTSVQSQTDISQNK